MLFVSRVSYVFTPVHCCNVVTCWEKADLLALVCDVYCFCIEILVLICHVAEEL